MSRRIITRRGFLRVIGLGLGATACAGHRRSILWTPSAAQPRLRVVFYTDVHARTEWETPRALERAVAAINAQKPDLVIAGGDLITDGFQSAAATVEPRWDVYLNMHRAIRAPLYPVLGNHDLVAALPEDGSPRSVEPRSVFLHKFGLDRTFQAFDAGGYRFLILDSIQVTGDELKYEGRISPEQIEWLKEEVADLARERPVVLVTHVPLLTAFPAATKGAAEAAPRNRVVVNNREVLDLFRERNLVLVLQGHLHVDEMLRWERTTFITGGAVCAKFWRGAWHDTEEGFGVVTLGGNRVGWEYIDYGWEARRPEGV